MAMPKVLEHTSVTATEWFVLVLSSQAVLNTSALFLFIFLALFSVPEAEICPEQKSLITQRVQGLRSLGQFQELQGGMFLHQSQPQHPEQSQLNSSVKNQDFALLHLIITACVRA